MKEGYKTSWPTKAVYIGGGALIIGGSIVWAKGISDGPYYVICGVVTDCLAYLHGRWERKRYHNKMLKKYNRD